MDTSEYHSNVNDVKDSVENRFQKSNQSLFELPANQHKLGSVASTN